MGSLKLKIFVSGKEGELDDERAIANRVIRSLGFEPVSSEGRPASDSSIDEEFPAEVRNSDIYIGIFGKIYSQPSIEEFGIARSNDIPPLVFEKNLKRGDKRKRLLDKFLKEIKKKGSGVTVRKYDNVVDLRKQIIESVARLLSKRFTNYSELKKQLQECISQTQEFGPEERPQRYWGTPFSDEYGRAKIVKFNLQSRIQLGKTAEVSATVRGKTKNGFLDLAIIDPDKKWYWFPDPASWDVNTDNGKLTFTNRSYSNSWKFDVSKNAKLGSYSAIMGIYENNYANRRCVHYVEKEFEVTDTA